MIKRGKTIPYTSKVFILHPVKDNQMKARISIFEGESEFTANNSILCSLHLENLSKRMKKDVEIEIRLKVYYLLQPWMLAVVAQHLKTT